MATVWIPPLLRSLTAGQDQVAVGGATIGAIIDELDACFPGLKDRLCAGGSLRPGLAAIIDSQVARGGLEQAVGPASEVHFVQAIGGGCGAAGADSKAC